MPETPDGQKVTQAEAEAAWLPVARELLIDTAKTYNNVVTYKALADHISEVTGIRPTQLLRNWIGGFLGNVGKEAEAAGEPHLTSLCVRADQTIGEGYPWVAAGAAEGEREEAAARDRLECYRRYATNLPAGGGVPTLTPKVQRRLGRRHRGAEMQFFWVNQSLTVNRGRELETLWAPLVNTAGSSVRHWDSLADARVGDIVLHYAHGNVRGASVVTVEAHEIERPADFVLRGDTEGIGRMVNVVYNEFEFPVALEAIPEANRTAVAADERYRSPFDSSGRVNNGYFFDLPASMAYEIFALAGQALVALPEGDLEDVQSGLRGELVLTIDETDGYVVAKYRKEQSALRSKLFGVATAAQCGICGQTFPVEFLHTAHIKPRSECSEKERRDLANVMPACLFGCDALFEKGHIVVDESGIIRRTSRSTTTGPVSSEISVLVGSSAPAWSASSSKYFASKAKHT